MKKETIPSNTEVTKRIKETLSQLDSIVVNSKLETINKIKKTLLPMEKIIVYVSEQIREQYDRLIPLLNNPDTIEPHTNCVYEKVATSIAAKIVLLKLAITKNIQDNTTKQEDQKRSSKQKDKGKKTTPNARTKSTTIRNKPKRTI